MRRRIAEPDRPIMPRADDLPVPRPPTAPTGTSPSDAAFGLRECGAIRARSSLVGFAINTAMVFRPVR